MHRLIWSELYLSAFGTKTISSEKRTIVISDIHIISVIIKKINVKHS